MSAVDNTPENKNFLSPLNFRFQIKKAPHVNFFVQSVNIPAISLPQVDTPNPFVRIPQTGDHISFEPLQISFKVDEDLQNYLEIHNWLLGLGFPESYDQYKELSDVPRITGEGLLSDITVLVLSSTKIANYEVTFVDAHPVALTELKFNSTDTSVNYISSSATFKYTHYKIQNI